MKDDGVAHNIDLLEFSSLILCKSIQTYLESISVCVIDCIPGLKQRSNNILQETKYAFSSCEDRHWVKEWSYQYCLLSMSMTKNDQHKPLTGILNSVQYMYRQILKARFPPKLIGKDMSNAQPDPVLLDLHLYETHLLFPI